MHTQSGFRRLAGITAISAGILALTSLIIGLAGVDYDFDVFSDTSSLIAIGADAARLIRWSYWLNMFGNYLLLLPLALVLYQSLRDEAAEAMQLYTLSGILYMALGAAGSAILAAAWPFLIEQYEVAGAAVQANLALQFQVVNAIGEAGLHGVVQNVMAAVWFLGTGAVLRRRRRGLGWATIGLGIFLVLNTLGNMFAIEVLSLLGLTANILLGPLWSIALGILLVQGRLSGGDTR